jgi:probable blue pigment (indigoidine) exporter
MNRLGLLLSTAVAPLLWGTTYLTTTALLPPHHPFLTATLRALPIGLILTIVVRAVPRGSWWWRAFVLGGLNIGLCFAMLFTAAYRLPGGTAATINSIQPLLVILLGWPILVLRPAGASVLAGLAGIGGVAMLVLGARASLDAVGVLAALCASGSMSLGTVLTKRWGRPPGVSDIAFTAWQLTAGGILLAPVALIVEGVPHGLSGANVAGYVYLGLCGTGLAYTLWFRGLTRLPAAAVTFLNLLVPLVATIAGFLAYGQTLTLVQGLGASLVVCSIVTAQITARREPRGEANAARSPVRVETTAR